MAVALPPGWAVNEVLESVPDPNGRAAAFVRRTFVCKDQNNQYVCASGDRGDCEAQALSMAQCWSQKQPYDTAR